MREAIVYGLTSERAHISDLARLPSQLATLKARVSRRLPLRDMRSDHCTEKSGEVALQIEEASGPVGQRPDGLLPPHPGQDMADFDQADDELIPNKELMYPTQYHVVKRVPGTSIAVDYYTGEELDDPSGPAPNDKKRVEKEQCARKKYSHRPQAPNSRKRFVDLSLAIGSSQYATHTLSERSSSSQFVVGSSS
jgi:hypothetical protein